MLIAQPHEHKAWLCLTSDDVHIKRNQLEMHSEIMTATEALKITHCSRVENLMDFFLDVMQQQGWLGDSGGVTDVDL